MTMRNDDDHAGEVVIVVSGVTHRASYDYADGLVYLHHPEYDKAPARVFPGGAVERTARVMLKELIAEIKLGSARKKLR